MSSNGAAKQEDSLVNPERLPLLYNSLVPLTPERHSKLRLKSERDFSVAAEANAIPLTIDEFPRAMQDYPIVIASPESPTPVALVGLSRGKNDCVTAEGTWKKGLYIPAYLRRYPFAFLKETPDAERHILCADLSAGVFTEAPDTGGALFEDDQPSKVTQSALEFCKRYTEAAERTRVLMQKAKDLDLVEPSTVTLTQAGEKRKIDGFCIISETKLRELDDKPIVDLVKSGAYNLFAAQQLSLSNFSALADA